ncbi:hypothetical protein V6Z12_D11G243500 [Gossypium hirsutum]
MELHVEVIRTLHSTLDFTDFNTCIDFIKGKQTNKSKKSAKRSSTILETIHSDICCLDIDKLDPMTINGYFIGYAERSKGYVFYFPSDSIRINDSINESDLSWDTITVGQPSTSGERLIIIHNNPQAQLKNLKIIEQPIEQHDPQGIVGSTLRRSTKEKKSTISKFDYNIGAENDSESFSQAMTHFDIELQQMDVKTTFLNGDLNEKDCSLSVAHIVKGDKFNLNQCPKNKFERKQMKNIPYAFVVGSLMYAQDYMLTYKRSDNLDVIGSFNLDFASCVDSYKSTSDYIFMFAGEALSNL